MTRAATAIDYALSFTALLSAALGAGMLYVAHAGAWQTLPPGITGMGINTAMCIFLGGCALGAQLLENPWRGRITTVIGIVLVVIPAVVLTQFALDLYPNTAWTRLILNARVDSATIWPGNMYPVAALTLILCGGVILALFRVTSPRTALAVQLAAGLVITLSVLSLYGHALGIILFGVDETTRGYMSWPAAVGLLDIGAGLVLACTRQPWFRTYYAEHPDRRILMRGALLLVVLVVAAGLLATSLMEQQFEPGTDAALHERALRITIMTVVLFAAAAVWLFHAQLRPIVRQLVNLKDELLKSEEAWRVLVHSIPDIVMTVDRQYRLQFINRVPEGLSAEQALGTRVLDYVAPANRDTVQAAIDRSFRHRTVESYETQARGPNDAPAWYATRVSPVLLGGQATAALLTSRDITERRAFEEMLFQREQEFRALSENSPDVIARFDVSLRHVYVNPAVEQATGQPREHFLGKRHEDLNLPPDAARRWTEQLHRVLVTGESAVFDFSYTGGAGMRHYQVRLVPERNARGEIASILAVARDISVLHSAEAVLRESEARFSAMAANLPGMVFQLSRSPADGALQFYYVSDGAKDLCGIPADTIRREARAFVELIHHADRDEFFRSMEQSLAGTSGWSWEGRLLTPHTGEQWADLRATPRVAPDADPLWNGIVLNVTTTQRQKIEIAQSRERLRELSAHHEQVREDERRRISREIHDELGQTLTALKMEITLARNSCGDAAPEVARRIADMTRLIDSSIDAVRAIAADLRPGVLDLGFAAAAEWQVQEFARRTGIPCEADLDDADIVLDDTRATALFRILQESLTNVVRHARATRVRVTLRRDDRNVYLSVEDNGVGVTPARGAARTFGLLGMRERATILNGELHVEAPPGGGTRIRVSIPLNGKRPS